LPAETPQEQYWNNKYAKAVIVYKSRFIPNFGVYALDVRNFFVNPESHELQKIVSSWKDFSDDKKAWLCLRYVIRNIKYVSDKQEYGLPEFWTFPSELLKTLAGDCDDGAILLANLMLASGIPYWKIRLTAGLVPEGGHAYVTYYCAKKDCWVALDWCYYPSLKKPCERPDYKYSRIYREVWFSWNQRYAFFGRGTRVSNLKSLGCEVLKNE